MDRKSARKRCRNDNSLKEIYARLKVFNLNCGRPEKKIFFSSSQNISIDFVLVYWKGFFFVKQFGVSLCPILFE